MGAGRRPRFAAIVAVAVAVGVVSIPTVYIASGISHMVAISTMKEKRLTSVVNGIVAAEHSSPLWSSDITESEDGVVWQELAIGGADSYSIAKAALRQSDGGCVETSRKGLPNIPFMREEPNPDPSASDAKYRELQCATNDVGVWVVESRPFTLNGVHHAGGVGITAKIG